jgi:hypothetical protein
VLADGSVSTASPGNSFADLFWALRGGGNSFGLVTNLELKTYVKPVVTVGVLAHGQIARPETYYGSVVDFALVGQTGDQKASVIPIANTGNVSPFNSTITYSTYPFWDGNATASFANSVPPSLSYFQQPKLPVVTNSFAPKTMHQWSEETAPSFSQTTGLRQRFYTPFSLRVLDRDEAVKALGIIHDIYFGAIFEALAGVDVWFTGFSPFPISTHYLQASAHANPQPAALDIPFGDPMNVTPENLLVLELSLSYGDHTSYEPIVTAFLEQMGQRMKDELEVQNLRHLISSWLYINDADKGQNVFAGYTKENVRALQRIREKYDPERVFTDLMPGGWKVADVGVRE